MIPPFVAPFLMGLVTAPLARTIVKPLVLGTVKTTIGIALQVRKLAAEAAEDLQDLAAEAGAGIIAAEAEAQSGGAVTAPKAGTRPAVPTGAGHKKP